MADEMIIGRLKRWSRRKAEARDVLSASSASQAPETEQPDLPTAADLASLDASSDYTRFLLAGVAPDLRVAALRMLWASDPAVSVPDGLIDYARDYTGKGMAAGEVLEAACRIGAGMVDPEEIEAIVVDAEPKAEG